MEWIFDVMENKWELYADAQSDEVLAEVGQDEDGTYYWIDLSDDCGYCGFETAEKAMADFVKETLAAFAPLKEWAEANGREVV